jgi:hypothetical protein
MLGARPDRLKLSCGLPLPCLAPAPFPRERVRAWAQSGQSSCG